MEYFCPRCNSTTAEVDVDEEARYTSVCSTCGGQLLGGARPALSHALGVVAFTFQEKSQLPLPIVPVIADSGIHDRPHLQVGAGGQMIWVEDDQEGRADDTPVEPPGRSYQDQDVTDPGEAAVDEATASTEGWGMHPDMQAVPQAAIDVAEADGSPLQAPLAPGAVPPFEAGDQASGQDHGQNASYPLPPADATSANQQNLAGAGVSARERDSEADTEGPAVEPDDGAGSEDHAVDNSAAARPELVAAAAGDNPAAAKPGPVATAADDEPSPIEQTASDGGPENHRPDSAAAATKEAPGEESAAELPAHLRLPTFPTFNIDFDTSSVLGPTAPAAKTESYQGDGHGDAGHEPLTDDDQPASTPAELAADADADADEEAPGALHLLPPPIPQHAQKSAAANAPDPAPPTSPSLPNLPSFGGDDYSAPAKKELTLLGTDAAEQLAESVGSGRNWKLGAAVVVVAVALLGSAAVYRHHIVALLDGPPTASAGPDETDRARTIVIEASTAFESRKYKDAVRLYLKALKLAPPPTRCENCWQGKAHRNIAVSYASLNNKEKAIRHYRRFFKLLPNAPEADEARKIIETWDKSKAARRSKSKN